MQIKERAASGHLVFLISLFVSVSSFADCRQPDMAGLWHLFIGKGSAIINVSGAGYVSDGHYKNLLDDEYAGLFPKRGLMSGRVDVLKNCRVVGEFQLGGAGPGPAPLELRISDSRTRPDTQYWAGNFELSLDWDYLPISEQGSFYAVRILEY